MSAIPDAGAHGGDAALIAAALGVEPAWMVDLSASMNPFAPDLTSLLLAHVERGGAVGRYPDPTVATERLAAEIGIDPELLVLTNGGAEAIALVAADAPVGDVVEPEFSLYRRHLAVVAAVGQRWRSNPSNPLGVLASAGDVAGVWDEAYFPLSTGRWTRGDSDAWRLGSLTKLWACPGLRLGYLIAPDAAAAGRIRARQPQWAVNGLALAMVEDLLAETDIDAWARAIEGLRARMADELRSLGYEVQPTQANWLLVNDSGLRRRLAPHGVVVRDCTSFGLAGWCRVALPAPGVLDRVLGAFAAERR